MSQYSHFGICTCRLAYNAVLVVNVTNSQLKAKPRMLEYSFSRLFVPWNIRSLDRSLDHSFPRTNKHCRPSLLGTFPGPFIPWYFRSRYPGPFLPRTIRSFVVHLQRRNSVCISLNFFVLLTFYFILFFTVG